MCESFDPTESNRLSHSWQRYDAQTLDTYLVSGVENPRINVQSIITRALLCDTLFPGRFTRLIEEELRFGYVMTWIATQLSRGIENRSLLAAVDGQRRDVCPEFVLETFGHLQASDCPSINYVSAALLNDQETSGLASGVLDLFRIAWLNELGGLTHDGYSLFEAACGSANDYRYMAAFGIARFFHYTGIDITPQNVANARARFPHVDFRVADILHNDLADNSFDFSFVHDLFEHLSPEAIRRAVEELLRVTRCEAWLHFFNVANMSAHQIRAVGSYHWNMLSLGKLVGLVERSASHVEVISIAELARTKFGFDDYYNPGAYTIIAEQ